MSETVRRWVVGDAHQEFDCIDVVDGLLDIGEEDCIAVKELCRCDQHFVQAPLLDRGGLVHCVRLRSLRGHAQASHDGDEHQRH